MKTAIIIIQANCRVVPALLQVEIIDPFGTIGCEWKLIESKVVRRPEISDRVGVRRKEAIQRKIVVRRLGIWRNDFERF